MKKETAKPFAPARPKIETTRKLLKNRVVVFLPISHVLQLNRSKVFLTSSANAMDVVFDVVWHIEVYNKSDVFDVEASGCHVSSHQHGKAALLKFCEGGISFLLRLVAVDASRWVPLTLWRA